MRGSVRWQIYEKGWNGAGATLEVKKPSLQNIGAGSVQVSMALGLDVQGKNSPGRRREESRGRTEQTCSLLPLPALMLHGNNGWAPTPSLKPPSSCFCSCAN